MDDKLALIGFGEAGTTFATSARWRVSACAFDIDPSRKVAMKEAGVLVGTDAEHTLAGARIVLSLVTASEALAVAREYAPLLDAGTLWCDMNSVAPETKRAAAKAIEGAGARYVDVAVMAPVEPARLDVPLLLSGPDASGSADNLRQLGFSNIAIAGAEIGRASAIKLCRSVMVKGVEALTAEMVLAAKRAGVLDEVLASLDASENPKPWAERAEYNLERMASHGKRRATEMEEAAQMLADLGIEPSMTTGTIRRQREAAGESKRTRNAA